jgi:predicted PurR-regulated permease PerM
MKLPGRKSHDDAGASAAHERKVVLPPPPVVSDPPSPSDGAPDWLYPLIRRVINHVVFVGIGVALVIWMVAKTRALSSIIFFAFFLAIAMAPGISWLNRKWGWSRGKATGAIFLLVVVVLGSIIGLLIPMATTMSDVVSKRLPSWVNTIDGTFHLNLAKYIRPGAGLNAIIANISTGDFLTKVLHFASSGVGLVFEFFTLLMFTFLIAVGLPGIERAILGRLKPTMQVRVGWAWDSAIQQTGGYFYSRLLLLIVNGAGFLVVMILVGMPWYFAVPLSFFQAFFAEFIPVVGTYIGIALPVLVTLGYKGWIPAVILLVWAIIYQQIENYWLSPRFASNSMEINAGLAFGAALFGGAIGGATGAMVAMPVAGMITAFVKNFAKSYPIVYESVYADGELVAPHEADDSAGGAE